MSLNMVALYIIRSPQSEREQQQYYDLRWRVLRAPWQQPRGSERDEHETEAVHVMAINPQGHVIGVARLHQIDQTTAQIRYMAVEPDHQKQGIGKALLHYLEERADRMGIRLIQLNAREQCIQFYLNQGYIITGTGPLLYEVIKHQQMQKQLT